MDSELFHADPAGPPVLPARAGWAAGGGVPLKRDFPSRARSAAECAASGAVPAHSAALRARLGSAGLVTGKKEAQMDEGERDYLRQQIRQLEQTIRRWKLVLLSVAAAFVILVLVGGVSFFTFYVVKVRWQREVMLMEMQRARDA